MDRNVLLIHNFDPSQIYTYFQVAYVFVLLLLMMPDTYLQRLRRLFFFSVKVLSLICLFIELLDSIPVLTFTTDFLHSKHNKQTQMRFYNQRPKQGITI